MSSLTAGKLGSTTNHYVEWMVACCICAGIGYSLLRAKYPAKIVPITILLAASVLAQNRASVQPLGELTGCGAAYRYVRDSPSSRVLSESLGPMLLAGKPVLVSDPFVYGQSIGHGRWPKAQAEELIKLIDGRYFGLIVMSYDPSKADAHASDVWPEVLRDAIARNYQVAQSYSCRDAGMMLEPRSSGFAK